MKKIEISKDIKSLIKNAANKLNGAERRDTLPRLCSVLAVDFHKKKYNEQ